MNRATGDGVVSEESSVGGRLVGTDGRSLPMRSVAVRGDAAGGLARIVLEHRFKNDHPDPLRVTYQDPCHLVHGQGIRNQPRQLLRSIPGLNLVELKDSDVCCGKEMRSLGVESAPEQTRKAS